ncbi:MAG: hypothetical protein ACI9F9_001934 [Candidatus Paceibacteria bacterium]|jgi:hypothetical protein
MNPLRSKRWIARLRRLSLVVAALGGVYLWQRYEVFPLPDAGCSPLMSLSPGSTLWVDKQPPNLGVGDVIFFTLPNGSIGFGRCTKLQDRGLWLETDVEACPAVDSNSLGWVERNRVHGRLIMAFDPGAS